jgi:hypothetical protein
MPVGTQATDLSKGLQWLPHGTQRRVEHAPQETLTTFRTPSERKQDPLIAPIWFRTSAVSWRTPFRPTLQSDEAVTGTSPLQIHALAVLPLKEPVLAAQHPEQFHF